MLTHHPNKPSNSPTLWGEKNPILERKQKPQKKRKLFSAWGVVLLRDNPFEARGAEEGGEEKYPFPQKRSQKGQKRTE